MRKRLILALLFLASVQVKVNAQNLFSAPDTVCINQPVYLFDSVDRLESAQSYFWGFCSGYTYNTPAVWSNELEIREGANALEILQFEGKYYGFMARPSNDTADELIRLDFGERINAIPDTLSLGTLKNTIPFYTTHMFFIQEEGNWHAFLTGGTADTNSSLARLDFGSSLLNEPTTINMGNLYSLMDGPRGVHVYKHTDGLFYGYFFNQNDNNFIRLHFGNNISITPTLEDFGVIPNLNEPRDWVFMEENGAFYAYLVNYGSSDLVRVEFGADIHPVPADLRFVTISNLDGQLIGPSAIQYTKDCEITSFFVTNEVDHSIVQFFLTNALDEDPVVRKHLLTTEHVAHPKDITTIFRQDDTLVLYFLNNGAGVRNLGMLYFRPCSSPVDADIIQSELKRPPVFSYRTPGTYTIFFAVNMGRSDMQYQCKEIVVLPRPGIDLTDPLTICQGDTVVLNARSYGALSYTWYPNYNISDTFGLNLIELTVWPEFSTDYHVVIPYKNGCIVDTWIPVTVSKIKADAGVDRAIYDGGSTTIGGPLTSLNEAGNYSYHWFPDIFLSNTTEPFTVANPPYDFTYYLEVRNTDGCYDIDSVEIKVECNGLNLPNAFMPEHADGLVNKFGIKNRMLVKVNHFRIFDRWGKEVFFTQDATKEWDGTINGNPAPIGVYVWEVDAFCTNNKRVIRTGNVTLIR